MSAQGRIAVAVLAVVAVLAGCWITLIAPKRAETAAAEAKIAQAEAQAAAEVRAAAVEAAVRASERVLRNEITGPTAEALLTRSLGDVRAKLSS